jgi:hypothetical protein
MRYEKLLAAFLLGVVALHSGGGLLLASYADGFSSLTPLQAKGADLSMRTGGMATAPSQAYPMVAAQAVPASANPYYVAPSSSAYANTPPAQLPPLSQGQPVYTANNGYPYGAGMNTSVPSNYAGVIDAQVTTIPKGQRFTVRLSDSLSSQTARVGDSISGTIDGPIVQNGRIVIPGGSEVEGSVVSVSPAGRIGKHGELGIRFYTIKPTGGGDTIAIDATILTEDKTSVLKSDTWPKAIGKSVGLAGVGTGLGALSGTAVGGILGVAGAGAAIGTGIGAVGGIGYALARQGRSVELPKGARLTVVTEAPTPITNSAMRQPTSWYGYNQ